MLCLQYAEVDVYLSWLFGIAIEDRCTTCFAEVTECMVGTLESLQGVMAATIKGTSIWPLNFCERNFQGPWHKRLSAGEATRTTRTYSCTPFIIRIAMGCVSHGEIILSLACLPRIWPLDGELYTSTMTSCLDRRCGLNRHFVFFARREVRFPVLT